MWAHEADDFFLRGRGRKGRRERLELVKRSSDHWGHALERDIGIDQSLLLSVCFLVLS